MCESKSNTTTTESKLQNMDPEKQTELLVKPCTMWEMLREAKSLMVLALPIALTALIFYTRSMVSMLFLGKLGEVELAAGSLAIAFANITGYSVLSGLSLGMEPLCSQAFGAKRPKLLSLTLQRCVIFLLACSIPISLLWVNMSRIFLFLHQQPNITNMAQKYLIFLLPDLITNSLLHPIRVYLRAQNITHPVTLASLAGTLLHVPFNLFLVKHGVAGISAASAASNFSILVFLVLYVWISGVHRATWTAPSRECFSGWEPLIRLAAPSCVSVCLEWWWYEIMIVLCGLLVDPTATVAAMGILIQTTSFIYVFPSSLGLAVSTRVGNELGAKRSSVASISAIVAVFFAVVMGFSAVVFASAMRHRWGRMFTGDEEILKLTSAALPILGLCELGNCPQTVGCGVVRGTARPNTAANVNLSAFYLVGMPVAVGLAFWFDVGFCGLWLGLLSAQVCCAGLMLYIIGTTDWEHQACRAQLLTSVDECRFSTAQSTPRFTHSCSCGSVAPLTPKSVCNDNLLLRQYGNFPHYMASTQSFKAKLRSHSAPKQRPEPGPKRRLSLNEMMESRSSLSGVGMQRSCSQVQEVINFKNAVMGKLHKSTEFARGTDRNYFHHRRW